jgi:hypothetical protein
MAMAGSRNAAAHCPSRVGHPHQMYFVGTDKEVCTGNRKKGPANHAILVAGLFLFSDTDPRPGKAGARIVTE